MADEISAAWVAERLQREIKDVQLENMSSAGGLNCLMARLATWIGSVYKLLMRFNLLDLLGCFCHFLSIVYHFKLWCHASRGLVVWSALFHLISAFSLSKKKHKICTEEWEKAKADAKNTPTTSYMTFSNVIALSSACVLSLFTAWKLSLNTNRPLCLETATAFGRCWGGYISCDLFACELDMGALERCGKCLDVCESTCMKLWRSSSASRLAKQGKTSFFWFPKYEFPSFFEIRINFIRHTYMLFLQVGQGQCNEDLCAQALCSERKREKHQTGPGQRGALCRCQRAVVFCFGGAVRWLMVCSDMCFFCMLYELWMFRFLLFGSFFTSIVGVLVHWFGSLLCPMYISQVFCCSQQSPAHQSAVKRPTSTRVSLSTRNWCLGRKDWWMSWFTSKAIKWTRTPCSTQEQTSHLDHCDPIWSIVLEFVL